MRGPRGNHSTTAAACVSVVFLLLLGACTGSTQPDASPTPELDPRDVVSLTKVCRLLDAYSSERRPRERRLFVKKIVRRYPEYGRYEARGPVRQLARKRVVLDVSFRLRQLRDAGLPGPERQGLVDNCGGFIRRDL